MNHIYCRKCKKKQQVVGFQKDDPILSCGHVKRSSNLDDRINECMKIFQNIFDTLPSLGDEQISYCPICDMTVSIMTDENGTPRCCGDMMTNPGCGCPVHPHLTSSI